MVLITLNIPEDMRDRLKNQPNQSGLVSELLRNYFNGHGSKTDLQKQLADIDYKKKYQFEVLEKEREKLEKEISLQERTEEEQKAYQEKQRLREEKEKEEEEVMPKFDIKAYAAQNRGKMFESVNRSFRHFTGRDISKDEYALYMKEYWDVGRPLTEFIEVAIKNLPQRKEEGAENGENRSAQTEKPYI